MGADVQFVQDLVAEFPYFEETYDAHCYPDEDVYPHVVFWDITQAVVRSFVARGSHALDWRAVLVFLEERVSRDVPEVTVVICTSFLWNLPFPDDPGYGITEHLGPVLARRFQEVRPNG
ncbi:hypothetical protein [Actinomadura sp. WMMB 499]|uniref:hypothetical protein n=1 Tax=Actinomadura sp. WMMB 499 TaxID=1219491 RepID=UPI0012478125|nr:hypothetical protein [Actinomadura sp. WMMB 499]QFG24698.1 hypothetical protein F7P10_29700 [Actinomadura sp. WMMB 499]